MSQHEPCSRYQQITRCLAHALDHHSIMARSFQLTNQILQAADSNNGLETLNLTQGFSEVRDHEMTWCLSWFIIMFLFCSIRGHFAGICGIPYHVPFSNTPVIGSKLQGPLNQLNPDPSYASRIRSFELARLLRKAQPRKTTTPLARKQRCRMMLV